MLACAYCHCTLVHKGKYFTICNLEHAKICTKYAVQKMQRNMHKYANEIYAIYVHDKPKYVYI